MCHWKSWLAVQTWEKCRKHFVTGTCLPRDFVESLSFEILKVQLLVALKRKVEPHNLKRLWPTSAVLHFSLAHAFPPRRKCYGFPISSVLPPEYLTVLRDDTEEMPESTLSPLQMETPIPLNNSPVFCCSYDTMILVFLAGLWSSFNKTCGTHSQPMYSPTHYSATLM